MNFWDKFEKGFTCLAPMEGVTDIAFRQVVAKACRPDIFFTEFTNVNSYSSEKGRPNALERLKYEAAERPIVAQIWGKNPEMFFETVQAAKNLGFEALDINMGCPDRHVVATGGGSGLIRTPELAVEILRAAQKVEGITVSVKTRLGYSKLDEWKGWLGTLLNEHPAALTVHLRTKKEMSKVEAHYELIPEIVELKNELSPETKLIINGDIKSAADDNDISQFRQGKVHTARYLYGEHRCDKRLAADAVRQSAESVSVRAVGNERKEFHTAHAAAQRDVGGAAGDIRDGALPQGSRRDYRDRHLKNGVRMAVAGQSEKDIVYAVVFVRDRRYRDQNTVLVYCACCRARRYRRCGQRTFSQGRLCAAVHVPVLFHLLVVYRSERRHLEVPRQSRFGQRILVVDRSEPVHLERACIYRAVSVHDEFCRAYLRRRYSGSRFADRLAGKRYQLPHIRQGVPRSGWKVHQSIHAG